MKPTLYTNIPNVPGTRMSDYVHVSDNRYAYAIACRADLCGHDVCWFVEDRNLPCQNVPEFPRIIRQEYSFDEAVKGL